MDDLRIVGPGKTRGNPYLVCKKSEETVFAQKSLSHYSEFIPYVL